MIALETFGCTFSPKINTSVNFLQNEDNLDVGSRLFKYQEKYRTNLENIKDNLKEYHPYKPKISKNTDKIILEREKKINEIKKIMEIERKKQESNIAEKASVLEYMDEIEENHNENDSLYHCTESQEKVNPNNSSVIISGKKENIKYKNNEEY